MRLALLLLLCAQAMTGAEGPRLDDAAYRAARANLQLFPRTPEGSPLVAIDAGTLADAAALGPVVERATFPRWRRFTGDGVSCDLPDHPAVVVRPLKPNIANRIFAERMRTAPDQFEDGYAVDVDGRTVLTIMTARSARFDDGVCFCGAVALQVFRFDAGVMRRFDLLANGEVKKVQALSRDHCATLMEWTHCHLHPDVYTRIALSLRPAGADLEPAAAEEDVINRYGTSGQLGLLRPGTTRDALVARLGAPFREEADALTWRWLEGRSLTLTRVPLDSARRFAGWQDAQFTRADGPDLPEPYGSPGWVQATAAALDGPELQRFFLEAWTKRLLPTTTDAGLDPLFSTLWEMTKERPGSLSRLLVQQLVERFPAIGGHFAAWLLHVHGGEAGRTAMVAHVEQLLTRPTVVSFDSNLLTFIGRDDPRRPALITRLLAHADPDLRSAAWYYASSFAPEVLAAATRRDVADPDHLLRHSVAGYWGDHALPPDLLSVLQAQLAREQDQWVADALRKAIAAQPALAPPTKP